MEEKKEEKRRKKEDGKLRKENNEGKMFGEVKNSKDCNSVESSR